MGLLTNKDATLFRFWFKENAKLRGISVKYFYPIESKMTIHSEFQSELSEPIDMDIIFDENPKINTLRAIGWVSENPDDKPIIAQLPYDAKEICTQCEIEISPIDGITTVGRRFKITSIKTLLEFPDCYTCTLAPVFKNEEVKDDYDNSDYNYIDTNESPEEVSPNNMINDPNYQYLNIRGIERG